jgi:hypothetical protein
MSSNSTFHEKKVRTLSYPALKEKLMMPRLSTFCIKITWGSSISKGLIGSLKVQWNDILLRLLNKPKREFVV